MELWRFLEEQNKKPIKESINMLKNNGNKLKGISEDADFDNATSFDDFMPNDSSTEDVGSDDSMFNTDDDYSFGGDSDYDENPDGKQMKNALSFLEDLDDSEVHINETLLANFSSLYHEQKNNYDRLLSEQLATSEYHEEIKQIREDFESTLKILKKYISNKFQKETTNSRVETFAYFKSIFNNLIKALNSILDNVKK